jgi:hypothetical protein
LLANSLLFQNLHFNPHAPESGRPVTQTMDDPFFFPANLPPPKDAPPSGILGLWQRLGHPITLIFGAVTGLLLVTSSVYFAWQSADKEASTNDELLKLLPTFTAKKEEVKPAPPTSSVIGIAMPANPKADLPALSLQDAAMIEVTKLHEPAGNIHTTRPLKELEFKTQPLDASDPMRAEATTVLTYYIEAKSPEDKSALVKGGWDMLDKMSHFYSDPTNHDPILDQAIGGQVIRAENAEILELMFSSPNRQGGKVSAYFYRTKGGALALDWESFVGFGDMNWAEYSEKRPQNPLWMRAIVEADNYYNYEFTDDKHLLSVRLSSPDGTRRMHGFVPRVSLLGDMLRDRLKYDEFIVTGRRAASFIVNVKTTFPYHAKSGDCVNIRELIADRWLVFDWETRSTP